MASTDEQHVRFRSDLRDGVLYVAGELEAASKSFLDAALAEAVRHAEGSVFVDLSAVSFCGSAGLACLVRAKLTAGDRPVVLMGVTPPMRRLLTIAAVDPLFVLAPSPADEGIGAGPAGKSSRRPGHGLEGKGDRSAERGDTQ